MLLHGKKVYTEALKPVLEITKFADRKPSGCYTCDSLSKQP